MDPALASLAGGIVGSSITLTGVWLKDRQDRKLAAESDVRRIVDESLQLAVRALNGLTRLDNAVAQLPPRYMDDEARKYDEQTSIAFYELAGYETLLAARLGFNDLFVVALNSFKTKVAMSAKSIRDGLPRDIQQKQIAGCGRALEELTEKSRLHLL